MALAIPKVLTPVTKPPKGPHCGLEYMAHIVETYAGDDNPAHETAPRSPDLITHVAGRGMTVHDGHRLPGALNHLAARTLTPKVFSCGLPRRVG